MQTNLLDLVNREKAKLQMMPIPAHINGALGLK